MIVIMTAAPHRPKSILSTLSIAIDYGSFLLLFSADCPQPTVVCAARLRILEAWAFGIPACFSVEPRYALL